MRGERICPLGCPVVQWGAHLQAQVFRISVSMGEQLYPIRRMLQGVGGAALEWKQGKWGVLALDWPQGSEGKWGRP